MSSVPSSAATAKPFDPAIGMQLALLLDLGVRLFIWSSTAAITLFAVMRWNLMPPSDVAQGRDFAGAWAWSQAAAQWLVLYNVVYLLELALLGLVLPKPKHGIYSLRDRRPDPSLLATCLRAVLTKARYQAPFPAVFVANLGQIAPLRWLLGVTVGPRTGSVFITDPLVIDPHDVRIGRNVTIGFQTTVAAHLQQRDRVELATTIIDDDVLIGGYTAIPGGCRIGRGAVIGGCSFLKPGTVVGENEFWAGAPAKKISDLPPLA